MRLIPFSFPFVVFFLFCFVPSVMAQTPSPSPTPPYILFIEPITIANPETNSPFTSSEEERNWNSYGYVIRSHREVPAQFTVQKTDLSFDMFTPEKPRVNATTFTLSSPTQDQYQILLSLAKPLTSVRQGSIPPTTCSLSPASACTVGQAAPWDDITVVGWGYSLKGDSVPDDFQEDEWYRPLSEDTPITIVRTYGSGKRTSTQMTWKIQTNERIEETYAAVASLIALPY